MKNKQKQGSLEHQMQKRLIPHIQAFHDSNPDANFDLDKLIRFLYTKDMSLKRKTQQNLNRIVEGAISVIKSGMKNDNESDDIDDDLPENIQLMTVNDQNFMNKSLLSVYNPTPSTPKTESTDTTAVEGDMVEPLISKSIKKRTRSDYLDATSDIPKKPKSKQVKWNAPKIKLEDLGGIEQCIEEVLQLIGMPLKHPEIYLHLGIQPPRGILLHGPPGCGKTLLAHAIAGECNVPFLNISAPSIVSGMSGESEKKIREVFEEARELAPCILFLDEIDAITPKRETAQREMERRIVAQLLTCMDDLSLEKTNHKPVILIGATNRPDSLDPALRRAGRFDREIAMNVPDEAARESIIRKLASKLKLSGDFDYINLAKLTPGYVGADLNALTAEAGLIAVNRIFHSLHTVYGQDETKHAFDTAMNMDIDENQKGELEEIKNLLYKKGSVSLFLASRPDALTEEEMGPLCITNYDFLLAIKKVQPSSKREGFAIVPGVTWDDIGALMSVREELRMAVVEPVKHPEYFARVGITAPVGVLLYGPPGCGKTLLAKAVANESHCNFISVKGPELLNKYVGESERAIRQVFSRAQSSSPCIIFFDELDALCPARSNDSESQSSSRLVNTLLTEMDGMEGRKNVFVIAATNRPEMIDPAMLRPGRLDKCLYVDLPNSKERHEILKTVSRKSPLDSSVNLENVAEDHRCDGFSGADLNSLVREAGVAALRSSLQLTDNGIEFTSIRAQDIFIKKEHFDSAFGKVLPSVSKKDRKKYELLKVKFGSHSKSEVLVEESQL